MTGFAGADSTGPGQPRAGPGRWTLRDWRSRMTGRLIRRPAVLAVAFFLAGALSGCASVFGGYDLAPNGLPQAEADLRRELAREPETAYQDVIEGETQLPDDDLLRLLYAATTGRYSGHYTEATQLLDVAGYVAEDRVTISVSRQALSFITSDRALEYTPSRTERLMIPYTSAVSFLQAGDLGGAVVEARRIEALLEGYDEDVPRDDTPASSRFLHLFAATIFDAAGEANSAAVAYRRAGLAGADAADVRVPAEYVGVPEDSMGEVVVFIERGFVPHRVEQSVVVALPPFMMKDLTGGDAGQKAAAAATASAQILLTAAAVYGDQGWYYTDHGYRRTAHLSPWRSQCQGWNQPRWCDDDGDPYLLRISWPVLYQDPVAGGDVRIRTDGGAVIAPHRLDVGAGIRSDFGDERGAIIARTVFRAAAKMVLSRTAGDAVGERDETAGRIVGFLVNLGTLLTERADTRSWNLLPGTVSMVRLRLPAGAHDLAIDGDGLLDRDIDLGEVSVRPGRTTFVAHRIWR